MASVDIQDMYSEKPQGLISNPVKFNSQDFHELREFCLHNNFRFEDGLFPPSEESIGEGLLKSCDLKRVEWIRPRKLHRDPHIIVDGASRFDIFQGIVGNCWFLAALGSLTRQKDIFSQVLPTDQGYNYKYAGIFHFRFWQFGKWVDVVIDDKLPILDNNYLSVAPANGNEFWPALLEKAYAKLCGSYADMDSGCVSEALMDFTGGIHFNFTLCDPPPDMWNIFRRAYKKNSLMACGTPRTPAGKNKVLPNGLVLGHAYAVTGCVEVLYGDRVVRLIRLWNPWGKNEWNGPWSDVSEEWNFINQEQRNILCKNFEDGEFWMSFEDFKGQFTHIDICNLYPDFLDSDSNSRWALTLSEGEWIKGESAGGSIEEDTFWRNPHRLINLTSETLDTHSSTSYNFVVYLMQKPSSKHRCQNSHVPIGVSIYKVGILKFVHLLLLYLSVCIKS
ncbi:calpain-2 catalytic subunit-like [Erpetoichthys calabaricus]|uniref:calpain-2 catalytic subunit-like n=1 Tax=Erpetoichthys calabaricus TaxID=27687 RepID=UPI0022341ECB|nr:calpain-2 catalytic subunit-like [Erpetoichthys calabaricus]